MAGRVRATVSSQYSRTGAAVRQRSARALVEGQRGDLGRDELAANIYGDGRAGLGVRGRHEGERRRALQRGAERAAGDLANARTGRRRLVRQIDRVAGARDAAVARQDADQLAARAVALLVRERLPPDEVRALVQLDGPAQAGFERRDLFGQLVAVEAIAGLQAQGVARAEARRQQAMRLAGIQHGVPEGGDLIGRAVQLEAVLAGVAGARDEAGDAGDRARRGVVVADGVQRGGGERL